MGPGFEPRRAYHFNPLLQRELRQGVLWFYRLLSQVLDT